MLEHIASVGEENCNMVCATHNEAGATHAASKVTNCLDFRNYRKLEYLVFQPFQTLEGVEN